MQVEADISRKVNALLSSGKKTLSTALGIEFTNIAKHKVCGTMPVDERTMQPFGLLHGGASVALAEGLASIGAWLNIDESKYRAVGVEINANHLRAMREGSVIGEAVPIHLGRTLHVWEISIRSAADNKPVCISRCTVAIIEAKD